MKVKPIIFSAPMVRPLLEGRKTMTRRVVKPQPVNQVIEGRAHITIGMNPAEDGAIWYGADCINPGREMRCPYGVVGDRLWARETWAANATLNLRKPTDLKGETIYFKATYPNASHFVWRPSIHMPRWASRITLEITGVKVERVQDIDDWDAIAEGLDDPAWHKRYSNSDGDFIEPEGVAVEEFRELWNALNGPGSWAANPWVWVVGFRRVPQ